MAPGFAFNRRVRRRQGAIQPQRGLEGDRKTRPHQQDGKDRHQCLEQEEDRQAVGFARAFEQALEYRDNLTPDARATLETSLSDYTVDRAGFATLFEAEVAVLDLERTLVSATVQTHIQAAAADASIGIASRGGRP